MEKIQQILANRYVKLCLLVALLTLLSYFFLIFFFTIFAVNLSSWIEWLLSFLLSGLLVYKYLSPRIF